MTTFTLRSDLVTLIAIARGAVEWTRTGIMGLGLLGEGVHQLMHKRQMRDDRRTMATMRDEDSKR